ncbi:snRNA-activating protein complex subunit-like [Prosopis cineraria]|uniref:snRNA-activating protein complex subunit-like n=1 Tax=Prosopis cineraria TaxID=364024 RepID=UPI00240EB44D|nr:snRNA-activating protein complex subunit-like [Prosopis cineraria]XP_054820048.1 snRNA-activating protein complex subunit-like [Prosopis cineraria]XP_054820049.1 snRNA-activating protein complex subunit-like [Prosopis cineraria]XP_054820050.1 snRNA-activating protein complex subunit-like [Prosopis cineraria]
MEIVESTAPVAEECELSIPRGGPIYVPNLVGPCTRVAEFENSVICELQNLVADLHRDTSDLYDDDISIDELKVYTEEELMNMAVKRELKGTENNENYPPTLDQSNVGIEHDHRISSNGLTSSNMSGTGSDALTLFEPSNPSSRTTINRIMIGKNSRRRRKGTNAICVQGGCTEKVDEVVKIKQKQEEDKVAVRLHSFNPACKNNQSALKSARTETMRSLRSTSSSKKLKSEGLQEHIPVLYPEVVLTVEVYHNVRKCVKTQELLVIGGQTLTALRDKIFCSMDQVMQKAGQHDPSGYFLIEDVFYVDMRDPSAIDYTLPIFDWLRNSKEEAQKKWDCIITGELRQKQKAIMGEASVSELPHLTSVNMQNIRFCDIRFRLGAGFLYCHQGDCTHTLVIRDMRLIHPDDVHNRAAYPIITFQLKLRFQKCSACKIFRATKVTVDDKWTPKNPCYFCDECFSLLHIAEDGSLHYADFLEYDYHHD